VRPCHRLALVEGNYLLLGEPARHHAHGRGLSLYLHCVIGQTPRARACPPMCTGLVEKGAVTSLIACKGFAFSTGAGQGCTDQVEEGAVTLIVACKGRFSAGAGARAWRGPSLCRTAQTRSRGRKCARWRMRPGLWSARWTQRWPAWLRARSALARASCTRHEHTLADPWRTGCRRKSSHLAGASACDSPRGHSLKKMSCSDMVY